MKTIFNAEKSRSVAKSLVTDPTKCKIDYRFTLILTYEYCLFEVVVSVISIGCLSLFLCDNAITIPTVSG